MIISGEMKAAIAWEKHKAKLANRRKTANQAARKTRRQQRKTRT